MINSQGERLASASASIGLTALLPGVDVYLLFCACAGGLLYVVLAQEIKVWQRVAFVPLATLLGYIAAYDAQEYIGVKSAYLAAFICGALGIAIIVAVLARIQNGSFSLRKRGD
jgi:uncharacterized membrane protein YjjB (DUF3815 family)